ncbi:MAG: S8 family serine peptidase, partial [Beijerinckiaceae bacterium]|nr:S8 family serine peptidase [Beijerinckiaceae bacterium]
GGYGLGVPLVPGYARGPYYDPYDDDEVIYTRPRPRGPSSVEVLDEGPIQRDQPRGRKPKQGQAGKTAVAKKPVKTKQASGGPVIRPPNPPVPPVVAPPPPPQTAANPPAPQGPSGVPPVDEQRYVPDEVVFEFKPATDPQAIDDVIARNRLERVASWRFRLTDSILYRYRITDGRSVPTVVAALEQDAAVQSAQPNYIYTLQQAAAELKPSDVPEATKASNSSLPPQYAIDVMHVADAHKLANGTNIIVSVIDSGVDTSHVEMKGVVTDTFDAIGGEARPDTHGTAMTGAIAAHGQLTGLAPDAHVVAVRAFAGAGQQAPAKAGAEGTTFHILRGLDWSYERQARIVNMSFAGPKDPALTRMMAAARAKKMILIAAAGNAGPKSAPLYPAADPNVIAVTATDGQNQPYANANRGTYISVASPGVDVLVAAPNGAYDFTTGTSVATAHVSGLAALILQRRPDLDQEAVKKLLVSSGKAIEAQDAEGARLVDAAAAVQAASGTQ